MIFHSHKRGKTTGHDVGVGGRSVGCTSRQQHRGIFDTLHGRGRSTMHLLHTPSVPRGLLAAITRVALADVPEAKESF
jgi:hypothetical protein